MKLLVVPRVHDVELCVQRWCRWFRTHCILEFYRFHIFWPEVLGNPHVRSLTRAFVGSVKVVASLVTNSQTIVHHLCQALLWRVFNALGSVEFARKLCKPTCNLPGETGLWTIWTQSVLAEWDHLAYVFFRVGSLIVHSGLIHVISVFVYLFHLLELKKACICNNLAVTLDSVENRINLSLLALSKLLQAFIFDCDWNFLNTKNERVTDKLHGEILLTSSSALSKFQFKLRQSSEWPCLRFLITPTLMLQI